MWVEKNWKRPLQGLFRVLPRVSSRFLHFGSSVFGFVQGPVMLRGKEKRIHFVLLTEFLCVGPNSLCPFLLGLMDPSTL